MRLAAIDALLARPFPGTASRDGLSGPTHLIETLRETEDFWDDPFHVAATAALTELEVELDALAAALTVRWGEACDVDLWSHLRVSVEEGSHPPEPIDYLSQYATSLRVWTPPGSPRWIGLTIGQGDPELPLQLFAAVGTASP
ncbi:hypothetical protein [Streptacidiphilus jiangxiensis]|uniref:Uncharacterized protein n=1 Tax=Streptacidiphilus jiangxiensis TaxID=235985 RepID=A0A1H7FGW8_STRJI|nr:hypothetical protein [Streptacidiphilus jiangxiensis]SEK25346.1 hypothetical protein SAMN05414137_101255 [Streptacidiphilus jiangxiensis]